MSVILFPIVFADDTSVFIEGESLHDIMHLLNIELETITIWLAANKLTINVVKSQYMVFHRARLKMKLITQARNIQY